MKRLFIKKLKDYNAYSQYRRNFSLFRGSLSVYQRKLTPRYKILQNILNKNYSPHITFRDLISWSFTWIKTDEGEDFWYKIFLRF